MYSRSVRHRWSRRDRPIVEVQARGVEVSLTDFATGNTQSFLIMPGQAYSATLTGILQGDGPARVLNVPLVVRARIA